MTGRAWLLAIAAAIAGVIAALAWPDPPKEQPVVVTDRVLEVGDLATFEKVCAQIAKDRADFQAGKGGADIPTGLSLGQFAHKMSLHPAQLEGTCSRAGTPVLAFLGIVSAMEKTGVLAARLAEFEENFEQRLASYESLARALEELGRTPGPPPDIDDKPKWLADVPTEVVQSLPAWKTIGHDATEVWKNTMVPGSAGDAENDTATGDDPPK